MKNQLYAFSESTQYQWTNGTGALVTSGSIVFLPSGQVGIAVADIANGAVGTLNTRGGFSLPKSTGAGKGFAAGDTVQWDPANSRCETAVVDNGRSIGVAFESAADASAFVTVAINEGAGPRIVGIVDAGEASGNAIDLIQAGLTAARVNVIVRSSAGAIKTPASITNVSGGIRVTGGTSTNALAAGDIVTVVQ